MYDFQTLGTKWKLHSKFRDKNITCILEFKTKWKLDLNPIIKRYCLQ